MTYQLITYSCPKCGKTFKLPADLEGKKVVCKGCQTHFVVHRSQAVGAASNPQTATAAAHAAPVKPAPASPQPAVAVATQAPPHTVPVTEDLATIPFDDVVPGPGDAGSSTDAPMVARKEQQLGKVKIEAKGPYFVVKLLTSGKMIHVNIENTLNEFATEGWTLVQIVNFGVEAYAIFKRQDGVATTMPAPQAASSA